MISSETILAPDISDTTFSKSEPVIEITDLSISFGKQEVLKKVSLKVFKNENLVIVGKSGTGKSVLIKCIAGLINSYEGRITVLEKDVKSLKRKELNLLRQKLGFLFQSGALYDSMTVRQNLEFPLRRIKKGMTEEQIKQKVIEALNSVSLENVLNKMPAELSGGMRKRVSLARSIIVDPVIILYDEPTTGLDPSTSDEISMLINDIRSKYHTSSVIITHDIKCALATADRIIMLKDGMVFTEGTCDDFENSSDPFIKSFFS